MKYRKFGKTDISVSEICLGTMTWGEQNTIEEAHQQLDYALDRGINFIDTAEMYPVPPNKESSGKTEEFIGKWDKMKSQRDKFILASKVAGPGMEWIRDGRPSYDKENLRKALESSLTRLQTDYLDLYQLHWPERHTNFFGQLEYSHHPEDKWNSFQSVLETLKKFQSEGKIRHIGLSNESAWGAMEWLKTSERFQLPRMSSIQNPYNLLNRSFEIGLSEVSMREEMGLLAYSPLGFGILTGKYRNNQWPEGARLTRWERFSRYLKPQSVKAVEKYCQLAEKYQLSPTQMALSFVTSRNFVTSNIIGATSMDQLKENIDSSEITLTEEILKEIEQIHIEFSNPAP